MATYVCRMLTQKGLRPSKAYSGLRLVWEWQVERLQNPKPNYVAP